MALPAVGFDRAAGDAAEVGMPRFTMVSLIDPRPEPRRGTAQRKATWPVSAWPTTSVCISLVPS